MRALVFAALLAARPAAAMTPPQKINFQGKLINPATNNPQTGPVGLTFRIYDAPSGGAPLYSETQSGVGLSNGVFSVQIGSVSGVPRDLFLGASAYLGVTVTGDAGGEMTPREQLVMSPYAFSAGQLSDAGSVRLIADHTYSTFTAAGNLEIPAGVAASSGSFVNGVTAGSGTFTATGGGQYSLETSSGILMNGGTLTVDGEGGVDVAYGLQVATIDFTNMTSDPVGNAGFMYYNSSTGSIKVFDGNNQWRYVFGQSLTRRSFITTTNTAAIAVSKSANAAILLQPFYLPGPMMVNQIKTYITTALGAAGDIGVYDENGNLVLNGGANTLTTATGLKTVAPAQTGNARFLPPGQYFAAVTFNSTTGRFGGDTLAATAVGLVSGAGSIAAGGGTTLPASVTPTSIVNGQILFTFELNP